MNIVCIGGGPSGLYFGLLMKLQHPEHDITVYERNKPYDTFGWGVVFYDKNKENNQQRQRFRSHLIIGMISNFILKMKLSDLVATALLELVEKNC